MLGTFLVVGSVSASIVLGLVLAKVLLAGMLAIVLQPRREPLKP